MGTYTKGWSDKQLEGLIGNILRIGVMTAAALVFWGGVMYLFQRWSLPPQYDVFRGEPAELRHLDGILRLAFSFHARGLIQFGLLVLIATPIARVGISIFAFMRRRDILYVVVTCIVFAALCYSLAGGFQIGLK